MDGSGKYDNVPMSFAKLKTFTQTNNMYFARTYSNERIDFKKFACGVERGMKAGTRIKGTGAWLAQ